MAQIRIVSDSTSDIPQELRANLGIETVPLKVHFGNETFLDSVTITPEQFYEKLIQATELPTTSQPSPADFVELYKRLLHKPDTEIISIHLSSALSGTYQTAVLAKSLLEGGEHISVVDSKHASYGVGILAVAAANAARAGKSREEILDLVKYVRNTMRVYFIVDTLEYLHKGGRIGKASALFGALLNIKPILTIDEAGEVAAVDKIRGSKKAMQRILELLRQDFGDKRVHAVIAHAGVEVDVEELTELVRGNFAVEDLTHTKIGPVIGTHVGPGTTAVFMYPVQ
ncbi:MAG TPA: DegV family protein [Bacilli bacterium]